MPKGVVSVSSRSTGSSPEKVSILNAEVKIPEERVGALIGEKRKELSRLEKATRTKMHVDENVVTIAGDSLEVWKARDVVRAIGRGFSPVRAMRLAKDNAVLDVIELSDLNENRLKTVRARVIGRGGRTREVIEELTGVYISVYGKTVSVIGEGEGTASALHAIGMLIEGANHATVYKYLEQWKRTQRLLGEI